MIRLSPTAKNSQHKRMEGGIRTRAGVSTVSGGASVEVKTSPSPFPPFPRPDIVAELFVEVRGLKLVCRNGCASLNSESSKLSPAYIPRSGSILVLKQRNADATRQQKGQAKVKLTQVANEISR